MVSLRKKYYSMVLQHPVYDVKHLPATVRVDAVLLIISLKPKHANTPNHTETLHALTGTTISWGG